MATTRMSVLVVVVVGMWAVAPASAAVIAVSAGACKEERRMGVNACKAVLYGTPPSSQCCARLRVTHWECICSVITRKLAPLVDVNRAVRLFEGCGRRVPRHFKCGSITTP